MSRALCLLALLGLVLVPRALAHAEIVPAKVPADSVARLKLHVEGEEGVPAVKVAVQLPLRLGQVIFVPVPGWKRTRNGRIVTWSGGRIKPGQFGEFTLGAHMPNAPGAELAFPTVQTYANGKIVRWIGAEGSDAPAPRVVLTEAKKRTPPPPPPPPVTTATTLANEDAEESRLTTWLVVGGIGIGLVAIGVAMIWRRRR